MKIGTEIYLDVSNSYDRFDSKRDMIKIKYIGRIESETCTEGHFKVVDYMKYKGRWPNDIVCSMCPWTCYDLEFNSIKKEIKPFITTIFKK